MTLKLRFPEFTDEWEVKKLGDLDIYVSDGNYGEMYPKASEMTESGVAFIRANNLKGGRLVWDDMKFISSELHSVLTSGHLKTGDTLVTTRGDIGTTAHVTADFDDANINAQICLLRPISGLDDVYLFQSLQTHKSKSQFVQLQTGSALKQLPKGKLALLKIGVPDEKEQKKIAGFLTVVDERVQAAQQNVELLKKYKSGVMQKIFTQQIRFKDENGKNYPAWQAKKLGDIAQFVNGYTFLSSTYSEEGNFKVITIANVQAGRLDTVKANKVVSLPSNIQKKQILNRGDMLISMTGNVGRVCIVDQDNCLLNQRVGKIVPSSVDSEYLYHILNQGSFVERMIAQGQGGAQDNLSSKDIMNYQIKLPAEQEQQKIANFLTSLDDKIKLEENKLQQAKNFKKALLQRMFV